MYWMEAQIPSCRGSIYSERWLAQGVSGSWCSESDRDADWGVLDGHALHIGATWLIQLTNLSAVPVWPYVKLLVPLVADSNYGRVLCVNLQDCNVDVCSGVQQLPKLTALLFSVILKKPSTAGYLSVFLWFAIFVLHHLQCQCESPLVCYLCCL